MTWPMHAFELSQLLDQSDHWINVNGDRIPVADLDPAYARRILGLLQRNAAGWKATVESIYIFGGGPNGDAANDAFDAEFDQLLRTKPAIWMQSTPLYRAIQRRTATEVTA